MQIKRNIIMALLSGVLLASCAGQATGEPTVDVNVVMTAGIGTFVAGLTQTKAAQATLATQTPSPTLTVSPVSLNTVTPSPTSTQVSLLPLPTIFIAPTATGTQYTPTVNPSSLGTGCNNLLLIRDESIPAGTVMEPGQEFTKIWKVENSGTCDWVYLYRLVFISGDRMGGESSGLGKVIAPGKWTQLSVGLKAPSEPGTYTGNWRFGNQSGSVFGSTLTVSIVVANPTSTPVTSYP
jgi:Ig-like domain from next to BRCA1 gene